MSTLTSTTIPLQNKTITSVNTLLQPMILTVFIVHITAILTVLDAYYSRTLSWSLVFLATVSFMVRMLLISGFYHAYFSHRSYKTSRSMQFLFAILGCTALQKGPIWWSNQHNKEVSLKSVHSWFQYPELIWLDKLHFSPWLIIIVSSYMFSGYTGVLWGTIIPQLPLWYCSYGMYFCSHDCRTNGVSHNGVNRYIKSKIIWLAHQFDLTSRFLYLLNVLGIVWYVDQSQVSNRVKLNVCHILRERDSTVSTVTDTATDGTLVRSSVKHCHNAIYEGTVVHTRYTPILHQFSYKLYLMYIELDENTTESAFDDYWFWSSRKKRTGFLPSLASFKCSEYLSKQKVQELVREEWEKYLANNSKQVGQSSNDHSHTMMNPLSITRVCLLIHFRYFGIKFNPVSYYYCFDSENNLVAMVSEVHNTPWSEVCWYVHLTPKVANLDDSSKRNQCCPEFKLESSESNLPEPTYYWNGNRPRFTDCKVKKMHVSPFFEMGYTYRAKYDAPDEFLNVSWEMFSRETSSFGRRDFYVSMRLRKVAISQSTLNKALLQYPLMTTKVVLAIYYQAALLYMRKVPFVTHPSKRQRPTDFDGQAEDKDLYKYQ